MSAATLIDRLEGVKAAGPDKWMSKCPAHEDRGPSLSVRDIGDRLLIHCFAGCEPMNVVHAVGLELSDLFADKLPDHSYKPTHRRIPASDALAAIDHEAHVVAIVAADIQNRRTIDNQTFDRLAIAVSRIGNARARR